ncbi:hypothetical protein [Cohnella thailandensis]|uniref:Protein-export membrane protein SecG n=1 Tax=Cohnella thailandensis TaxID=557557 RepID=A0A841T1Y2_9BACL|nr:hypothetical protein [Cohnella thailandensis]MBB6638403.1 hypothetical protein [Cohnella thailandensis]MBP1977119.1 flagellar basal body-associated protein FliL [Cohnella thailandensis]
MNSTLWLVVAVVVVMIAGLIGTIMIGQSPSNREENSQYSRNSGKIWANLTWIYAIGMILVVLLVIWLFQ